MRLTEVPEVAGVRHREVDIGDVRLHFAEAGKGPPLVLLHGWPQHWWCWRHLIPRLAEHHRVLAPDLRGWGWSSAPPGPYRKATFAADLLALLDAEGIDRADIVGHDWGGYTAFLLALDRPERIGRLVALDIVPPWPGAPRPRHLMLPLFASYQVVVGTPVLGERTMTASVRPLRAFIRAGSGRGARWRDDELDVYGKVLRDPARARASSACYRTFLLQEAPAQLRRGDRSSELKVPTLLLMGGASLLRRTLDPQPGHNLRVETVPGAGHFLPEEAPDEVFRRAREFLTAEA